LRSASDIHEAVSRPLREFPFSQRLVRSAAQCEEGKATMHVKIRFRIIILVLVALPAVFSASWVVISKCDKDGKRSKLKHIIQSGECHTNIKFTANGNVQVDVASCNSGAALSVTSVKLAECIPSTSLPIFKKSSSFLQVYIGDKPDADMFVGEFLARFYFPISCDHQSKIQDDPFI
jgi:hypothetical protein